MVLQLKNGFIFNKYYSFKTRIILSLLGKPLLYLITFIVILIYIPNNIYWVYSLIFASIIFITILIIRNSIQASLYWVSYLSISEGDVIIRVFYKNSLILDDVIPLNNINFLIQDIVNSRANQKRLVIKIKDKLSFSQYPILEWGDEIYKLTTPN